MIVNIYFFLDDQKIKYIKSGTNFILIKSGENAGKQVSFLLKEGVIVRDMTAWGLTGYLRMNIGTKKENDIFIEKFKQAIT